MMKMKLKRKLRSRRLVMAVAEAMPVAPAAGSFPVIAMAASVGGLKALSVILSGLPADFPAAIAIVMHLSPLHKSILAEILNSRTHLVVKQANTGDILSLGSVFVAPPNHHLLVAEGGRLELSSAVAAKVHYARPSAEPLFVSVAAVYQRRAIAVVLTGGDGDGSFGVQVIKERGGMVIAQDRPTSQDFSMPETAIKTGDVDFILPLEEIGPKLLALVRGAGGRGKKGMITRGRAVRATVAGKLAGGKSAPRSAVLAARRRRNSQARTPAVPGPVRAARRRRNSQAGTPAVPGKRRRAVPGRTNPTRSSYSAGTEPAMVKRKH